ncbi:hypothetical protein BDK51DRAFT_32922 [Blyttiomyces helicus]|uniref:Uncharacterized protein n=1 Tax=Blyttiomyces helicus TaxID=388810 RepID=A0A4P9VXQ8_9FUNG|nr:hypothetical protein BDK51DRAFT_32922 [Blyttiomyces helicus]|eukprot:RKO84509.1 hypothetical protein BDK51DRAFT_32922 [Blyttiomyces helicus]
MELDAFEETGAMGHSAHFCHKTFQNDLRCRWFFKGPKLNTTQTLALDSGTEEAQGSRRARDEREAPGLGEHGRMKQNGVNPTKIPPTTSQIQLHHLEIDLSLLSEKEKKPNFIRILQVLSTTANHHGRAKDLQNRYDNLLSNTNKVIIPITVNAWNKIHKTNKECILHDESDSSCMFEGYHRICKGKNSPSGKSFDCWVNTTLFPIYKRCDTGESVAAAPIGRHQPYSRRGSASSVVSSRSRRSSTSGSNTEAVGEIGGRGGDRVGRRLRGGFGEACFSARGSFARRLGGSTDEGESVEDATPGDSSNTSTLGATATVSATISSTLGARATLGSTLGETATLGATTTATLGASLGATAILGTTLGATAVLGATSTIGSMSTLGSTSTLGATSSFGSTDSTATCPSTITLQKYDALPSTSPKNYNVAATSSKNYDANNYELLEATKGICGRIDLSDDAALYPLRELASEGHSDGCLANGVNGIRLFTDCGGSTNTPWETLNFSVCVPTSSPSPTINPAPTSNSAPTQTTSAQGQIPQLLDFNMHPVVPYQPATASAIMAANPYGFAGYGLGFGGFGGHNFGNIGMGIGMGGGMFQGNGFNGLFVQQPLMPQNASFLGDSQFTDDMLNVQPLPALDFHL